MRLKEDQIENEEKAVGDHEVITTTSKVMYTTAECAGCFGQGMCSLMDLGDVFAEYVSVITGKDGLEAIIIPQSIFDVIELPEEPENYLDDMLKHLQADPEADSLHIILADLDDRSRSALLNTIKTYFQSEGNGYTPTADQMKGSFSLNSDDLPTRVREVLDKIIKIQKEGK